VVRCLRKAPAQRFPSAHELVLELKSPRTKPMPLARRRFLWGGAVAAAAAVTGFLSMPQKWRRWLRGSGPRLTSLAVLPLHNLSNNPDEEYFADGMTEVLIVNLSQISSLRTISRTSVMQFKDTKKSLAEIARQLNVDGIIEGSVLRSGDHVRITAELIDVASDNHLWANSYDRKVSDVLTLQGELAREIASEVRARITTRESGLLARNRTVSEPAIEAYLKGRFFWGQYTDESLTKSIEAYQKAIELHPSYAEAYAGLSESWTGLGWIGARPWEEVRTPAKEAAEKALALDDSLSDAHAAIAVIALRDWDWKRAEEEDQKAIALNPNYVTAHLSYSNMLRYLGRAEESIAEGRRALELDPLAVLTNEVLAEALLCARRPELAVAQCQAALEVHPEASILHYILGWSYVYEKKFDAAIESITKSNALDEIDPDGSPDLACILAMTGKKEEARKILALLLELAKEVPVDPGMLAMIYCSLGERQQALSLLEQAYARHSSLMTWIKVDPRFDILREEPRFQQLLHDVGLI
jgi:TolB-like protein